MSNGIAPSRSAISATLSAGTNRNSASRSTNFLISQGHATRSTFTLSRVIHFIASFLQLLIQSLEALDALRQKFGVAHFRPRPAAQHGVDSEALRPLKLPILQIGVVDHLRHLY